MTLKHKVNDAMDDDKNIRQNTTKTFAKNKY